MQTSPETLPPQAPSALLESLAATILCVAIVGGPLALGGTPAWARFGLEAAMATAAILWAVARPRPVTALAIPLGLAALVLLQLLPLPDRLLTAIAPVSAGAWKVAQEGMPGAWGRISVTPAASAAAARRLLLAVSTILVVAQVSGDPRRRRWLYTALATAGVLVWAVAFVFPIDPDNRAVYGVFSLRGQIEFWKTPELPARQTAGFAYNDWVTVGEQRYLADGGCSGDGFGPYIYSNHFANALALTLPAICGIMIVFTRRHAPRWAAFIGVALVVAAAAATTGVLAGSRAGTAALLLGVVVYLSLVVENRWLARAWRGLALAGVAGLLTFVAVFHGPFDSSSALIPDAWEPLATRVFQDGRISAARIAERMFVASPALGTGLGSFGDLYPRFAGRNPHMYFAHNDFMQLFAEGGLAAFLVVAVTATVLIRRFVRFCRARPPTSRTIDAAAWAAVATGAAHSVFDWNMHAPANALLACVVTGLAVSSVVPRANGHPAHLGNWRSRLATAGFTAAVVWATTLLARDAAIDRQLEDLRRAITVARLAKSPDDHARAVEPLTAAIAHGETVRGWAARDWPLPALLGQAQLHLDNSSQVGAGAAAAAENPRVRPAADWFREAMLASPACRGLPEPVPKPSATKPATP